MRQDQIDLNEILNIFCSEYIQYSEFSHDDTELESSQNGVFRW